ncbi:protein NRT1/ PTR FAMILY 4.5-like [Malania oleifera]|uniref:protein NRT1/ PTR FAMILY 4.5-like n=1 Tax=Malania oleifera TaxID=397392 RepID=UPI0025AE829C|nr:protein NRT1/ PTR FAMILY 4.5-like [Malania oleifera]
MGICGGGFRAPQQPDERETKLGGTRAVLFVYGMEGLEIMAYSSIVNSLVIYFSTYMNFSITRSATTLTNFMGTTLMLALFAGFVTDTYLSRFNTCVLFGCIELLGYTLLTIQAHFDQLRPIPCKDAAPSKMNECHSADGGQAAFLFIGLYLISLGSSGVKAALPPLGAGQFNENDPKEKALLSSYFNWFWFSLIVGSFIGVTLIVWISSNKGWDWAFAACAIAVLFGIIFLCIGKSVYRHDIPNGNSILRILQVFVAAIRNRNLPMPENAHEFYEIHDNEARMETEILQKTDQFRFLDRAAIVRINTQSASTAVALGPWHLCTVTQIEETKILIRMLPIILSTIFMNTCVAQAQTFFIQQSSTMDTRIMGFRVPSPSLPAISLLFMLILIPVYDRIFIPLIRKFTGIPTGIQPLQRVGVGLLLSTISMAIAGVVETRRKSVAVQHNMVDSKDPLPMSMFWLGFQYVFLGATDVFTLVGILEFFYAESSPAMKSLSTAISSCSVAFGYFTNTVMVEVVNKTSGGWLASNNLNRDKLNYYYWLLAGLSALNFGFYLVCASWYRYKKVKMWMEVKS